MNLNPKSILKGEVDAIVLTGGLVFSKMLTDWICERVQWIAPILIYPGEDELLAMTQGALRALHEEDEVRDF